MEDLQYNLIKEQYDNIKEDLQEIKVNVKETNGRVGKLEFKSGIFLGIGIVLSVLIIPIILVVFEKNL